MNKPKRVGLLGGTFDPFHNGHINLGLELQEKHALDEVIVCPAAYSPFKSLETCHVSASHRLEMVRLAVEDVSNWRVIDWEIKQGGPSYTIETVQALITEANQNKEKIALYLLLGQDILEKLADWKNIEELLTLANPLIGIRGGYDPAKIKLPNIIEKSCRSGMTTTKVLDISSTWIRNRLKKRLHCQHLLPAKVLDFIYHHQLYLH